MFFVTNHIGYNLLDGITKWGEMAHKAHDGKTKMLADHKQFERP